MMLSSSTFDTYSLILFEAGKRFLEKSKVDKTKEGVQAYLMASLLIVFSSLEAFLNGFVSEHEDWDKLTVHELALLKEKEVVFEKGQFIINDRLKISRITEKIELILKKFNCKIKYRQLSWWANLKQGLKTRNSLVHPKDVKDLKVQQIESAIYSIIECLDLLFKTIYKRGFPRKSKELSSSYFF